MNLNELQSVQSRERQTDSLQQLRDSFYQEVGRFIQQLKTERQEAAAAADDPFDSAEVQRLTDEIKTAEETVEAVYERRIGKLVKQASLEAAGMAADADGMTAEERDAFDELVATIEQNREHVLGAVVGDDTGVPPGADVPSDADVPPTDSGDAGSGPDESDLPSDVPPDVPPDLHEDPDETAGSGETGGVDAADAMGDGPSSDADSDHGADRDAGPDRGTNPGATNDSDQATDATATSHPTASSGPGTAARETGSQGTGERPSVERATVRITADVGEILGVDERSYDLASEDVVTLPEANAGPLVQKGAAERLD